MHAGPTTDVMGLFDINRNPPANAEVGKNLYLVFKRIG
jgi:hypothetical protein